jgi:hypothetical protein
VILLLVAATAALFFYGVTLERTEFAAVLGSCTGEVEIVQASSGAPVGPVPGLKLVARDRVRTGADGTAVLVFVDGSALELVPETEFTVRAIECTRSGRRTWSFWLAKGGVIARVSGLFGGRSRAIVCTPGAVTAVRGTGYKVVYAPETEESRLLVYSGSVELQAGTETVVCRETRQVRVTAGSVGEVEPIPEAELAALRQSLTRLATYRYRVIGGVSFDQGEGGARGYVVTTERREERIGTAARTLVRTARQRAQALGLARGSWDDAARDAASRKACTDALALLQQHLDRAVAADSLPEALHPVTLAPLPIEAREADRIAAAFAGAMLQAYSRTADGRYTVRAQAKDDQGTMYELTPLRIAPTPAAR